MNKYLAYITILFLIFSSHASFAQKNDILNEHLKNLYLTNSSLQQRKIIKKITKLNYTFDSLYNTIKLCDYHTQTRPKTGYTEWIYLLDSLEYTALIFIPNNYTPQNKYPVSVILHGGISVLNPTSAKRYVKPHSYDLDSIKNIIIYPNSWFLSKWWQEKQLKNIQYLLRRVKQTYNIDENKIYLSGISDGGTGIIYQANLDITPWANFKPYISNPGGMRSLSNKNIYLKNFWNRPFLFISSEQDELFPPHKMDNFLKKMDQAGNTYHYILASGYKHEISWLPDYRDTISNFTNQNPRNPLPSTIFWQTNDIKYNRNHWVVIDKLGSKQVISESEFPEITTKQRDIKPSGFLEVKTNGNQIIVNCKNIKQYTLLLSPDQFDFNDEIEIYTNNKLSYKGAVTKDQCTLLRWFTQDLDRTMLFGTQIRIKP